MWPRLLEWCADVLAGTNRRFRYVRAGVAFLGALVLLGLFVARFGAPGLVPVGLLLALVVAGAREVFSARDRLWRAALLPLDDERQHPHPEAHRVAAPTAIALGRLATAVDAARRGRYVEANDLVPQVERDVLRAEERLLVEAVRSMVSLGLGDVHRAAQIAVTALPTGSGDIDRSLGRAVLSDAWGDSRRLRAIDDAWARAGVGTSHGDELGRLRSLARLRVAPDSIEALSPVEAAALVDEARAVGDDELAVELTAVARRSSTYR